jgi:hypothetical protein
MLAGLALRQTWQTQKWQTQKWQTTVGVAEIAVRHQK